MTRTFSLLLFCLDNFIKILVHSFCLLNRKNCGADGRALSNKNSIFPKIPYIFVKSYFPANMSCLSCLFFVIRAFSFHNTVEAKASLTT